jgi:aspartate aminotransferase/aminotransferase
MRALARNAEAMPASGIREIVELAVRRPGAIRLEIGEPDFPTPAHIVAGAERGIAEGFTRYTQSAGLHSLRELLAEQVERQTGVSIGPEQITITVGGVQSVFSSLLALLNPGEEVLLPDPGWPNFEMSVLVQGGRALHYPLLIDNDFIPRLEDLERLVTPRTRVMIVNSPSNPTGAVFPPETIRALIAFAQRHDLWVLADEVYGRIVFEGEHVSALPLDPERVLLLNSFSKTYSMTGWRVGYIVANREVARLLHKIQEPQTSSVAGPCQKAAEAALTGPQDCIAEMRASYKDRRDAVLEVVRAHGLYRYTPHGAFYLMLDISPSGLDGHTFALRLLEETGVAVAPGSAFGTVARDQVRISLATERSQLLEGVERACQLVNRLAADRPAR